MDLTEQGSNPDIDVQQYTFEEESSLYHSKKDMVKKLSEERNLLVDENFKLMQEVRNFFFYRYFPSYFKGNGQQYPESCCR